MGHHPPTVCIISSNRFQSELLALFLQTEADLACTVLPLPDFHSPGMGTQKVPDLVLWDAGGKGGDGFFHAGRIGPICWKRARPYTALFNVRADRGVEFKAIAAGMRGVFFCDTPSDLLARGIKAILNGELWYSRECLSGFLEAGFSLADNRRANSLLSAGTELTGREYAVLEKIAAGLSSARIAADFSISPHTVKTHIRNIYKKLGVSTRLEAIRWYTRNR